ncbi:hypothetical protein ACFFLM_17235 [Deinococcus oregonensis]|uniref:Uncharacterized protein n=1 Tax=Deinococcus oregonensis TaxID=1805970 RepID=A0ABV6B1S2_9DEIO
MRSFLVVCLLWSSLASAGGSGGVRVLPPAPTRLPASAPVQPGQAWVLTGTTAEGEQFQTVLRLAPGAPTLDGAWTFRADRGVLLYDSAAQSVVGLDLKEVAGGGLALACVRVGRLSAGAGEGVLVSGTAPQVASRLEEAFAVAGATPNPADLAAAAAELRLGRCTLTQQK